MERVLNMASYWSKEIGSILGPCASDTSPVKVAATSAACKERFPVRTMEQIEYIPVPQASASQVIGSHTRLDESVAPVYHQVRQETTQNIVEIPTVQEQVIVQEIPEVQVVEQIQEQIVETIKVDPLERRTICELIRAP